MLLAKVLIWTLGLEATACGRDLTHIKLSERTIHLWQVSAITPEADQHSALITCACTSSLD